MDAITLLPDAISTSSGVTSPVIASALTAVQDETDSTYIVFDAVADVIRFGFANYDLGGNKRIWGVYAHTRMATTNTATRLGQRIGPSTVTDTSHLEGPPGQLAAINTIYEPVSKVHNKDWTPAEWTQAQADGLHIYMKPTAVSAGHQVVVYKVRMGLFVVHAPIATITYPAQGGSGVMGTGPVQWQYTGNGEPQWKFRVKVFTAAVVDGAGFDPATAATVHDSGDIESSATQYSIPASANLTPGASYGVSVETVKNMNFSGATGMAEYRGGWSTTHKFTVNNAPIVTLTYPANGATLTDTNRPIPTWTHTDVENDVISHRRFKVFTPAQYGATGFNPETSAAFADSGDLRITKGSTSWQSPALSNGTWRIYVKIRQEVGEIWSAWTFNQFTVDVLLPTPPVFNPVPDVAQGKVTMTIQRGAGGETPDAYTITRSDDGGATFKAIRGVSASMPYSGNEIIFHYDHEYPPNKATIYRAVMFKTTASLQIQSNPTDVTVTAAMKLVWVKDPADSSKNFTLPVENAWVDRVRAKARSVRRPLGRTLPVVTRGTSQGETFDLNLIALGQANYDKILALLDANKTLLIQTSKSQWYVEVMSLQISEYLWDEQMKEADKGTWRFTATVQETAAP